MDLPPQLVREETLTLGDESAQIAEPQMIQIQLGPHGNLHEISRRASSQMAESTEVVS